MRTLTVVLGVALAIPAFPTASAAAIFAKISDGTVAGVVDGSVAPTPDGTVTKGLFRIRRLSPAPSGTTDVTDTMNVLTCATRPCTVFFPSGAATLQAGDTFKFQDVSSTVLARVEKFDSGASADRVSLKGVKITSLTSLKILTVTFGVQPGDLRTITSTASSSYSGTAALSGTFRTSGGTGLTRATACTAGTISTDVANSCVKVTLAVNGTTVNGTGATAIATVSVPCNNLFPTVNPCGTNGTWSSTGSFAGVNDTQSINCPSPCTPAQVGTLVAEFNGVNEALQLSGSAHGGMANLADETGGREENFLTLADELGANRWVTFTAANERCRAVPKAPTINDTRNVNNNSNLPISFELWCGFFVPATGGVPLISIVDPNEAVVPGSAGTRNDASRVGFLPQQGQLALKDINVLSLVYDVFVGPELVPLDSRLGTLMFTDCTAGSLRVEVQLRDSKGVDVGILKLYLGSNTADNFRSLCDGFESIGLDLVNNPDARVDPSALLGNLASPCCITFKQAQGKYGKFLVRKMALLVDHGDQPLTTPMNHEVTFFDGNINGVTAASFLEVVTGIVRTFDLSTNGVSIVISKLTLNQVPLAEPLIVKVIRSADIQINGGKFVSSVNVNDLQPDVGGTEYAINLCPNGVEVPDPPLLPTVPLGICIPDQAIMTLL
jgi:hypothetical protein